MSKEAPDFCYPPPAEKLQNFFGVFLQFQIGVDNIQWDESTIRQLVDTVKVLSANRIRIYLQGGIEIEQELVD